jgi:hypothetical protein
MNITYKNVLLSRFNTKERHIKLGNRRCFYIRAKREDEYENYCVFQHKHIVYHHHDIHTEEVDDHLEAAYKMNKEDKDDYFMSNGLDYDRCYEYINVVKYLNRCLKTASKNVEHDSEFQDNHKWKFPFPGWSILVILGFVYHFVKDDM